MSSMGIVEFLAKCLDKDQAAAEAATPGPWLYNPGKMWLGPDAFERFDRSQGEEYVAYGGPSPFTGCVAVTGEAGNPQSMADAAHIACHAPDRVLREVAAKRKLIELHAPQDVEYVDGDGQNRNSLECATCDNGGTSNTWPCDTTKLLAAPYADRPGYKEEWKP